LEVWWAASAVAHAFLGRDFLAGERDDIATHHLPAAETWAWNDAGRIAGFVALLGREVAGLFVDPGSHRRGIGHLLVDHAQHLKGDLEVEVFKDYALGRSFYRKYGFTEAGEDVHAETGFGVLSQAGLAPTRAAR
jgi:putative acetyltransferase